MNYAIHSSMFILVLGVKFLLKRNNFAEKIRCNAIRYWFI